MGSQTSLPAPCGPFQVGYIDLMTEGSTTTGSFIRIHYPAPANTSTSEPPLWTGKKCTVGMVNSMVACIWNWPSWGNCSEYLGLDFARKVFTPASYAATFNFGWGYSSAQKFTIPICKDAPIAPHVGSGWPVVVFSHGMGSNRYTMSQVCYQLASMGVVVVAIDHREGSAFWSFSKEGDKVEEIHHLFVPVDEHEYEVRNKQVNHRCEEVIRTIEILDKLSQGKPVPNVYEDSIKTDLTFLKSSLDLTSHLYLMGHSLGGATVLLASSVDARVKAVLALDPWMFCLASQKFQIDKATLVVNSEKFLHRNNLRVIEEASKNISDVRFKVFPIGVHLSSTDLPSVFTQTALRKALGFMDVVQPETVTVELNKIVWDWFKNFIN